MADRAGSCATPVSSAARAGPVANYGLTSKGDPWGDQPALTEYCSMTKLEGAVKFGNNVRHFEPGVIEKLATCVYALADPRDKKVFYVGKGNGDRLFAHFREAEDDNRSSSKVRRIREIWNEDQDVDWFILRWGIRPLNGDQTSDISAEEIEAAVIDCLAMSQNGPALNDQGGKRAGNGLLNSSEVRALGATAVNPNNHYPVVFVFPIQRALEEGRDPYEATRRAWTKSDLMKSGAIAVGLSGGISRGVFCTDDWEESEPDGSKMMFVGEELIDHELQNRNWAAVTAAAGGFWQYGGYLVVEFDGAGHFRFLRGSRNKDFLDLNAA